MYRERVKPYVLSYNSTRKYWCEHGLYFADKVIRWCPVKEIMALLNSENDADNAGGSIDG